MIDFFSLYKTTKEYKAIYNEKQSEKLSHAYLFISPDEKFLGEFLKTIAKVICCEKTEPCNECRTCKLIEKNEYADVYYYPKEDSIKTEDVANLIEESHVKPIEGNRKVFILNHAESMNAVAQNKLLKTLEEPPKNVYILMGSTSEFSLLPTVKSRVKKYFLPPFTYETLFNALKEDCSDLERLKTAILSGDGTVGKALSLYEDENFSKVKNLAVDIICNMQSSKDILAYSTKVINAKIEITQLFSVLKQAFREMLMAYLGQEDLILNKDLFAKVNTAKGFKEGSLVYAIDKIGEAEERKKFNATDTMVLEWLFFQILEGKYKWQKL